MANVGVYGLGAAVTVSNFATIEGSTTVVASMGVDLAAGGAVSNGASGATAALISGQQYGVIIDAGGSVGNYGTITAAFAFAARLALGGTVTNAGVMRGGSGVAMQAGRGIVTNSGTITGSSGAGVELAAGGTITDSGTIAGSGTP